MNKKGLVLISVLFSILLAGCSDSGNVEQSAEEAAAINDRIKPVGTVNTGAASAPATQQASAPAASSGKSGKDVYTMACFACHGTGAAGAPKMGDKGLWSSRIAQGMDVLTEHAIKGFSSKPGSMMPAKGGNMSLSDAEVKAAVEYIVSNSK
ncbi:MAG: c-type cytochrome [Gammaproteobacteria bacterium]|nr:c-type cytochrome [Gammaproteobacteria bacterium]MDH5594652.1 c-type cytochrome [Gammaproteobacteria bacterium]MDH5614720.1 c-type cytochrome [Gammaproteobacteria bacterium]